MNWKAGSSVVDPVLGSGIKWTFGPWIRDKHIWTYFRELSNSFWVKNNSIQRRDPGWKFQSRDKHPGSPTLVGSGLNLIVGSGINYSEIYDDAFVGWRLTCEAGEVWECESVDRCLQLCGWGWGEVAGALHHLAEVLLHHVPAHKSFDNPSISLVLFKAHCMGIRIMAAFS
jgi:hypothetical protein